MSGDSSDAAAGITGVVAALDAHIRGLHELRPKWQEHHDEAVARLATLQHPMLGCARLRAEQAVHWWAECLRELDTNTDRNAVNERLAPFIVEEAVANERALAIRLLDDDGSHRPPRTTLPEQQHHETYKRRRRRSDSDGAASTASTAEHAATPGVIESKASAAASAGDADEAAAAATHAGAGVGEAAAPRASATVLAARRQLVDAGLSKQLVASMREHFGLDVTSAWHCMDEVCFNCGSNREVDVVGSVIVCPSCGNSDPFTDMFMADTRRHKEKTSRGSRQSRMLRDLETVQAKETRRVPDALLTLIAEECVRRGNVDAATLDVKTVDEVVHDLRKTLKATGKSEGHGISNLYSNVPQIHWRLTGRRPPQLTFLQERKIRLLFIILERHFDTVRQRRQNFIKYSFTLYHILQRLANTKTLAERERRTYENLLPYCSLLKCNSSLQTHTQIFRNMEFRSGISNETRGLAPRSRREHAFEAREEEGAA